MGVIQRCLPSPWCLLRLIVIIGLPKKGGENCLCVYLACQSFARTYRQHQLIKENLYGYLDCAARDKVTLGWCFKASWVYIIYDYGLFANPCVSIYSQSWVSTGKPARKSRDGRNIIAIWGCTERLHNFRWRRSRATLQLSHRHYAMRLL